MSYGTVQAEKVTTESGYSLGAGNASNFKNRIINGAMVIDQRNAGASALISTNGQFSVDRWAIQSNPTSKVTIQQNAGAVTPPAGFSKYLGVTVTTNFTPSAAQYCGIAQSIEANNMIDFEWGTANAKSAIISFWVRSSVTGTFGGALQGYVSSYSFPFSYTINSANTWEFKTIAVPAPTSGTFGTGNTGYTTLNFSLGTGSNYQNTAGSWINSNSLSCTGETQLVATSGATFYITGVQLEVGTVATSFDWRPYTTEYALCQRYYQTSTQNAAFGISSTSAIYIWKAPVTMRARPSLSMGGAGSYSSTTIYYESYPWNTAGTLTGAVVSSTHASVSGGDVLVTGTYSAAPATNQVLNLFNQYAPDTLPYQANQSYLIISSEL